MEEAQAPEEITETVEEVATLETEEVVEAETQEEAPEASTESTTATTAEHNESGYERRQKFKAQRDRADQAEKELQHLKEQMYQNNQAAQPTRPVQEQYRDPRAPQLDQFDDVEDYMDARDNYRDTVRDQKRKSKSQVDKFTELEEAYRLNNSSYDDDLAYGHSTPPKPVIAQEILKSPLGPQLLQAFKKDESLARRLNSLDDGDAIRELIKLEEKVKITPAVSSAPAPISTPKTSISKGSNKFSGEMSQADYNRQMAEYRKSKYG